MADQVASIEIRAKSAGLSAQLREARAQFGQFADGVSQIFIDKAAKASRKGKGKGFGERFGDALGVAGGNLLSAGVSKATGYIEEIAKSTLSYEDRLTRLQILANSTPEAMRQFSESVKQASGQTGKSKDEILDAAAAYVALTGDMDVARRSTSTWAKVAQATNSTVSDISQTAAAMSQNLKITPEQMEEVFSALNVQGKAGAIELKDLAGSLSQIAPQWAMFSKGTGVQGVRDLGAALQIVKRGFGGGAEETITGLQSFLTAVVKNAPKLQAAGVKGLFTVGKDGKKQLTDVFSIVDAIGKSSLVKDPTAMEKAFGRVEAYRAYLQLSQNRKELQEMSDAGKDAGSIQRDLDTYTQSSAGRTKIAIEHLKNAIADAFTPERIEKFANMLERILGYAEKVAGFVDSMLGGDEGVKGTAINKLIEGANGGREDEMVQLAKDAVRDPTGKAAEHIANVAANLPAGGASPQQIAAAVEGAKEYLKSEGVDITAWSDLKKSTGFAPGDTARRAMVGAMGPLKPDDIVKAITNGIKGLNLQVMIDGKAVATSVKESPTNRHGVKH